MTNRLLDLLNNNAVAIQKIKEDLDSKKGYMNVIKSYLPDYNEEELINDLVDFGKSISLTKGGEIDLDQLNQVAKGSSGFFNKLNQVMQNDKKLPRK